METIALIGPYDPQIKTMIRQSIPAGFTLKELSAESEYSQLHDANYIILRTLTLTKQTINSIPNLKLIQRWGVGYDTVDIEAAGNRNIPVAITSGMNAPSVSEMTVLLMLAVYRKLPLLHHNVLNGKWRGKAGIASSSYVIDGKTVGLIGLGAIGKQVVQKVRAFGATVVYYDLFRLSPEEEAARGVTYAGLEDLLKVSDIISLHLPLNDKTKHLISSETIRLMKPSAIIINTARGGIINEAELVEALQNNRILGAGLDVVEHEPPAVDSPLLKLQNVVLSPHMGGSTFDINVSMVKRCIDNISRISRGEHLRQSDVVNGQYLIK
ncbi:MAG: 2-hydroxyacid dehydrogenase [Sporomusaceae bacterium]|nr:2-hydroxyacid dehydrogenase [Sporomusaceae bacterium]